MSAPGRLIVINAIAVFLLSLILFSCNSDPVEQESDWEFADYYISDDCNIYKILLYNEEYVFVFTLAGPCSELSDKEFIEEYERFYLATDSLPERKGKVVIEYYEGMNKNDTIVNSIIEITKRMTHHNVVLCSKDTDAFEIIIWQ